MHVCVRYVFRKLYFRRQKFAKAPLRRRGGKENEICRPRLRQHVENVTRDVLNATLVDEDKRWADPNLPLHFLKGLSEIQRFKSRLPR